MKNTLMHRSDPVNLLIGFLSGAVICLAVTVCMLLFAGNPSQAFAQTSMGNDSKESVIVATAPTSPGGYPYMWVLYQRPFNEDDKGILGINEPKGIKRMTLCCYSTQITGSAIKLVGIRDITFDVHLIDKQGIESATPARLRDDYLQLVKQIRDRKTSVDKDKDKDDSGG